MNAEQLLDELRGVLDLTEPSDILNMVRRLSKSTVLVSVENGKLNITTMTVSDAQAILQAIVTGISNTVVKFE